MSRIMPESRMNGRALDHMISTSGSLFKLRKILSRDVVLRKKHSIRPFRTEKSTTFSLVKSDCQSNTESKNLFKTQANIQKLSNIINIQKKANNEQHQKVIKHLLAEKTYLRINKVPFEGNSVRTLQRIKSELSDFADQELKMQDLRERVKTKLQERDKEYKIKNADQLNHLQLKISNLQASSLFKHYLLKNGYRQPAFLKDVI